MENITDNLVKKFTVESDEVFHDNCDTSDEKLRFGIFITKTSDGTEYGYKDLGNERHLIITDNDCFITRKRKLLTDLPPILRKLEISTSSELIGNGGWR